MYLYLSISYFETTDKFVDRLTHRNGLALRSSPSREEFNNGGLSEI